MRLRSNAKRARQTQAPQKPASIPDRRSCSIVVGKGLNSPLPHWNRPILSGLIAMSRPEWEDGVLAVHLPMAASEYPGRHAGDCPTVRRAVLVGRPDA